MSLAEAERLMEDLVDEQLVDFVRVDGSGALFYRMHDLIRLCGQDFPAPQVPVGRYNRATAGPAVPDPRPRMDAHGSRR
jgi:hypothetical protein